MRPIPTTASLLSLPQQTSQRFSKKAVDSAQQFEALLLRQIFASAKEANAALSGGKPDQASESILDMAGEHLADLIASRGGLGLSNSIASSLSKQDRPLSSDKVGDTVQGLPR